MGRIKLNITILGRIHHVLESRASHGGVVTTTSVQHIFPEFLPWSGEPWLRQISIKLRPKGRTNLRSARKATSKFFRNWRNDIQVSSWCTSFGSGVNSHLKYPRQWQYESWILYSLELGSTRSWKEHEGTCLWSSDDVTKRYNTMHLSSLGILTTSLYKLVRREGRHRAFEVLLPSPRHHTVVQSWAKV